MVLTGQAEAASKNEPTALERSVVGLFGGVLPIEVAFEVQCQIAPECRP